jgi:hypothetical protein
MSIQDKIQDINDRAFRREIGVFLGAAAFALCFIFTAEYYIAIGIFIAYMVASVPIQKAIWGRAERQILETYRYQVEPIFEIQQGENDKYCLERAEHHRQMLTVSGNEIWKRKLITVEEFYDRDPRFGYAETPDEQAIRRADFIREFLNNWALNLTKENALFVKQWLNKQVVMEIEAAETVPQDPSVSEAKMGNYWTFPLLTKLAQILRGKEVSEA